MKSLGEIGYEAYAQSTGGKTFDGRDMPTFAEVFASKPHVAKAWEDAAIAQVLHATGAYVDGTRMTFGSALALLKCGKRVARVGWNGKGMWIALTPSRLIPTDDARHVPEYIGATCLAGSLNNDAANAFVSLSPHIDMKAADGTLVVGWLASQTDMLAEDWTVLP